MARNITFDELATEQLRKYRCLEWLVYIVAAGIAKTFKQLRVGQPIAPCTVLTDEVKHARLGEATRIGTRDL